MSPVFLKTVLSRVRNHYASTGEEIGLFLVLAAWALVFFSIDFHVDFPPQNDDSLMYLTIGKSFAQGLGYQNIAVPVKENNFSAPSAFPIVLMFYWLFFAPHLFLLKAMLAFLLIAGVWFSYVWLKMTLPRMEAFLIALAFASLPEFIMISNSIMTEILFVPVLYLGLLFSTKFALTQYTGKSGWLAALCWVVLARTRVVGIIFLITFLVLLLIHKQWRKAAATGVLFILWLLFEKALMVKTAAPYGYGTTLMGGLMHSFALDPRLFIETTLHYYGANLVSFALSYYAKYLFPFWYDACGMNKIKLSMTLGVFLTGMAGFVLLWKAKPPIRPFLIALCITALVIFKWDAFGALHRYLFPFYPFLVLAFVYSFHAAAKIFPIMHATRITLVMCLCIAVQNGLFSAQRFDPWAENWWDRDNLRAIHASINSLPSKPALIISSINRYTYLKTGIHSVQLSDTLHINGYCRAIGVTKALLVERECGYPESTRWRENAGVLLTRKGSWALYALTISTY